MLQFLFIVGGGHIFTPNNTINIVSLIVLCVSSIVYGILLMELPMEKNTA